MSHKSVLTFAAAALAATALSPPAAMAADTLLAPAPGAKNLAFAGGWSAWAAPAGNAAWKLTLRAPDGTVSQPDIPAFGAAPDPSIGSDRHAAGGRRLLVVYSRCQGASSTAGCDVYALDVSTGKEEVVKALASKAWSETAVSMQYGSYTFVRRGSGARKGLTYYRPGQGTRRIAPVLATETAFNGSRVAYAYRVGSGGRVAIRRISGEGTPFVAACGTDTVPRSLVVTRYQAAWLQGSAACFTTRFGGSGGPYAPRTKRGTRTLPATVNSIAVGASTNQARFLDAEGVKAADPNPFR